MSTGGHQKGKVAQVIGPVVDIEFFTEHLPPINQAITIDDNDHGIHLTCEVAGHLADNTVRTVAMSPTQGLVRGMEAVDTGATDLRARRPDVTGSDLRPAGQSDRRQGTGQRQNATADSPSLAAV
jgi:F0F1-type ATP synthase beta subunit